MLTAHDRARTTRNLLGKGLALCLASLTLAACGAGGGSSGGSISGAGTGGTQAQGFVNPAWSDNAPAPRTAWPANPGPAPVLSPWFGQHAWLSDVSLWVSYMENSRQPGRDMLGAYGVGNGHVFAMAGLSYPLNTLHGMVGPLYQLDGGYFGDMSVGVEIYPRQVAFAQEWAMKPRRAGVVITKAVAADVELYTVDYAPPGVHAILRQVIVRNPKSTLSNEISITARVAGGSHSDGQYIRQDRGGRKLAIGGAFGSGPTTIQGEVLKLPLGRLQPGEEKSALIFCAIETSEPALNAVASTLRTTPVDHWLSLTRDHWAQFFAAGAQFAFPDPKVQDWIEDMTCTIAVQTSKNGTTSPMSRYTKTWSRDQEGALRLYLRSGRPEPIRKMLDAFYKTSIVEGGIFNSMTTSADLTNVGPAPDWMTASFMPGREKVEVPSYIPIELYDYWKATGDTAMLIDQYDYMKAAILRQERSPDNLMKFNGDEPFRWVLMVALALYEPENRGWSSYSGFLFVAAAERMAKIATMLGKPADAALFQQEADIVRAATEQHYWLPAQGHYDVAKLFYGNISVAKPFEDISLMPFRIGYGDARHPNLRQNLLTVKGLLETNEGLLQSNAVIGNGIAYDGMVPGYYLSNLTIIDHPDAERTFNALEKVATVSGEVAEGQFAGSHGAVLIAYDPAGGGDIVARYRPWEGGICAESALWYLFGEDWDAAAHKISLTPHMPNGWGEMSARGLKVGGQAYDVEAKDFGLRRLHRVTNRSTAPLTVNLGASITGQGIGQVRVDGVVEQPLVDSEFGRHSFRVERTLAPGAWIDLDFDYVP